MKQLPQINSPFVKAAVLACALITVAGCGSPRLTDDPTSHDPRLAHPIQVAREQVSITIALPEQGTALAPEDQRRMRAFIRDFVGRGRSSVMVESYMGERSREVLEAQGLRANEIIIAPDTTIKAPNAVMTFTANVAQPPTCGAWSTRVTFNPTNNPEPDFGCASRHNMAITVTDPGDLVTAQPMSGRGAARRDVVLDGYKAGQPIGPPSSATSTQTVSGVQ